MRAVAVALLLLALPLVPSGAAEEQVVGSGNIAAGVFGGHPAVWWLIGGPTTEVRMPYEVRIPIAGLGGTSVEALVRDNGGVGYFVEMAFYAGTHLAEAECEATEDSHGLLQQPFGTAEIRDRCVVPDGVDLLVVYAHTGLDLDVTVVVVPGSTP